MAVTLAFRHGISETDGVCIGCRLGGSRFNLRRFQAKIRGPILKTS